MLKHTFVQILFLGSILLAAYYQWPWYVYGISALIFVGIVALGSFKIQLNYHLKAFHRNKNKEEVALTFDDGPTPYTLEVLDLLKQYNQKATFFCIGKQVDKHPEIVERIIKEGHCVGNHTFNHSKTTGFLSEEGMIKELEMANASIGQVIHKKPLFFRPPYGVTNPSIQKAVQYTQHHVMGWSIRSLDTLKQSAEEISERVIGQLANGKVILMHDTSEKSVKALERVLQHMEQNSWKSISLDQLFDLKAYEI